MSATVSTPVIAIEVVEKKVRVPTTLPAKYGKFIQFGYYLMNKLNASVEGQEDTPPMVDEKLFLDKLHFYDSLPDQQAFVEEFFESSKSITSDIRNLLQQRKRELAKAAKPIKEKKTRQPKSGEPKEEETVDPTLLPKKPRGKAKKLPTTEDQLVNELVQLAEGGGTNPSLSPTEGTNGIASLIPLPPPSKKESAKTAVAELIADVPPIADPVKETKPKSGGATVPPETPSLPVKATKSKADKETKPKAEKQTKPKAEKPEKVVKPKETKLDNKLDTKLDNKLDNKLDSKPDSKLDNKPDSKPHDDNDTLHVSVFEFNQQKFLIDDLLFVYDFHSQNKIGQFIDNTIVLL